MFNLLDLMRAAQGGAAMENMSRQFGLSLDQTRRATEALMPAFALGFQRNTGDPMGFANLLRMMGSGQYAGFFEQPGLAFTPRALAEGNQILGQLFGPEVSRQVADQAAAWSGVAPDLMRQMMPPVAAMLMGGLFKSAASEGVADMFEQFAKLLRGGTPAGQGQRGREAQSAAQDALDAWSNMVGGLWGARPPGAAKPEAAESKALANPFAPWAALMSGMLGPQAAARPEPDPPAPAKRNAPAPSKPNAPAAAPHDPFGFFSQMVETGLDVQQQYGAALQKIFDSWGAGHTRR